MLHEYQARPPPGVQRVERSGRAHALFVGGHPRFETEMGRLWSALAPPPPLFPRLHPASASGDMA